MTEDEARAWLRGLPEADALALDRLDEFVRMLGIENERQNLVARATMVTVWSRHVIDSAQLLGFVPRGTSPWLDLGSGPGLPGMIVAILRPELEVVLVESRSKRVVWLREVIDRLELANVKVEGRRLEAVPTFPAGVISARAFAPLDRLVGLAARFSTSETLWLLPKGQSARQELDELAGWQHMFHVEQSVTDSDAGVIVGRLLGKRGKRL